MNRRKRA